MFCFVIIPLCRVCYEVFIIKLFWWSVRPRLLASYSVLPTTNTVVIVSTFIYITFFSQKCCYNVMFFDFYINWRPVFSWSWVAGSMLHVFGSRCSKPVSKLLMFPFFLIVRCLHQFCTLQVVALRLPRTISWTINATKTFPVWGHNWITLPLKNLIHFSLVFILLPFYSDFIQRN